MYVATEEHRELNVRKLEQDYGLSFHVAVMNTTKGKGELINISQAGKRFTEFLASGAIVPFVAGEPWIINNNEYYDGGMYYIEPSLGTQELGCTHTLSLNTKSQDSTYKPHNELAEHIFKKVAKNFPAAAQTYLDRYEYTMNTFNKLPYGETTLGDMKLYRHALLKSPPVGRITRDREKLTSAVLEGYQSILDIFYQQGRAGIKPALM